LIQIEDHLVQKWKIAVNRPQDENKAELEKELYDYGGYGDQYDQCM